MRNKPAWLVLSAFLCGCAAERAAPPPKPDPIPLSQIMRKPGGFYSDDAPDGPVPVNLDTLADARPRVEPLNARANEPYTVFGREYVPYRALVEYRRQGTVSWYGRKFHGQRTWSGEVYDMYAMTAAHPTLPIPSYAKVTNLENGRSVVVRINDRGPFHSGRVMDVSYAAAYKLGFAQSGVATAEVESIVFGEAADAPATLEARPEPSGITLQLGAFGSSANAESFRDKIQPQLAGLGLTASSVLRDKLYRVIVGPFTSRAEASTAAEKLRESLGIKPVVTVR
ncbi:MAG: septal ring lytic transglycosylase RlpA family protein [Betaproteobacteria bacterium]|nr:septal ring lytic transglycosylase RlpA family protein [Betaproteobacteria bacterium]